MISLFTTIIKTLFTNPLQRLIGLLTLALIAGGVVSLIYWDIADKVPPALVPLLVYTTTITLGLPFGLFALLIVTSFKNKAPYLKVAKLKNLSQSAINILKAFGQQKDNCSFTTKELSEAFEMIFQQTQLAVDQLMHYHLLNFDGSKYSLNSKGRTFLDKHNLL